MNQTKEKTMSKTYERADKGTVLRLKEVMQRHRRDLVGSDVRIDVLFVAEHDDKSGEVFPALKNRGYPAAATIKILSLKERTLGLGDALMTIDTHAWKRMGESERDALLDHELEHLQVRADPGGFVSADGASAVAAKLDDLRRPLLKLRLHDWQLGGFRSIANRHGESAPEVKAVRACRENGQYFWDWDLGERLRVVGGK